MLRTTVAYDPSETALSWLGRLAAVETGQPVNRILTDLDVDRIGYAAGKPGPVTALAIATGLEPALLLDGSFYILPRETSFRGEGFSKDFVVPWVRKACPACLRDDGERKAWRHRLLWCFRVARSCPIHRMPLVDLDGGKAIDIRAVPGSVAIQKGLLSDLDPIRTPQFLDWLDRRIMRLDASDEWLAGQTIEQVLAASEVMGAVLEHGHDVRLHALASGEREAAAERGFAIYVEGSDAVRSAIDDIRARAGTKAAQAGPLAIYGRLYDWLATRSNFVDPGPIRAILRDHIVRHSAVDCGETVLGEVVSERRFHSLGSLAETTGLTRRRLFLLLQKLGHIGAEAAVAECGAEAAVAECGALVFPVGEVEAICADLEDPILLHDVAAYVGASNSQALAMYRSGILRPIFPAEERGEVRRIVFARRHLDGFLERIAALPVQVEGDERQVRTVALACQGGAGPTADVIAAVLSGACPAVRVEEASGVNGIRILV